MRKAIPIIVIILALVGFLVINNPQEPNENQEEEITIPIEENTEEESIEIPSRESKVPQDTVKITPETDKHPPITVSDEYEQPVPLPYPVNTKGAEDSAFIMPDGNTLYVWFTPNTKGDVYTQSKDMVTGIYILEKVNDQWQEAERVWLSDPGVAVLDGCEFISDNKMWFCTVREGYTGLHWFTAEYLDGKWTNWLNADFKPSYEVGELHIHKNELYFHSAKSLKGGYDIWVSRKTNYGWGEPDNLAIVNSEFNDGWPWISQDGDEMWFTRQEGAPNLYRSIRVNGQWTEPELMIKTLAGEPSLDNMGNVYFTHHFYDDEGNMLESDIYVAYKKNEAVDTSKGLLKGVSASPKSFEQDDFTEFLERVKQTQDVLLWAGDWIEVQEEKAPITFSELAKQYDYIPIIEVGHYIQESGELFRPLNNETKLTYLESTVKFAREYKPKYFGIGVEINIFAVKNPEAFEEFVHFYKEVYGAVKVVSPDTKIFTVFQLEKMKGLEMWELEESNPHWEMIEQFKTDIVAFTTYPSLFYRNVSDIPIDHYTEILSYVSKPIAFTEIGWHSATSPTGWESSEQEQAEFIETFFELTKDLDVEIAVWTFMYDLGMFEPFNTMGLINSEGKEKLAWNNWIK
ncbi:hypothetical protein ACFL0D_00325 [Thermoproteota archaeon]